MFSCFRLASWLALGLLLFSSGCSRSEPRIDMADNRSNAPIAKQGDGAKNKFVGSEEPPTGLHHTPRETARRKWHADLLVPQNREKILKKMEDDRRKDSLYADVVLYTTFCNRMVGRDQDSGIIPRYAREFGSDFPPVRQLRAYFDAHPCIGGKWKGGRRPSLKLIEAIDKELGGLSALELLARARNSPSRKKRIAEKKQEILERGACNLADAIAGVNRPVPEQSGEQQVKDAAALDALLGDPDATSQLGLTAGAYVRFRDLQNVRGSAPKDAAGKARQIEEAMVYWAQTSNMERHALKDPMELEKFLDSPQKWMDTYFAGQENQGAIRRDRETNAELHKIICEKCPRLFPLGRAR